MKWRYISAQKLETKRSNIFPLSISLKTKDIASQVRVPETGKYSFSSAKSSQIWSKSRCAQGGLGYSISLKIKWGYILIQKLLNRAFKYFSSVHVTENKGHHQLVQSPSDWKISPKFRQMEPNLLKIKIRVGRSCYSISVKIKRGYSSLQKLETERSNIFSLSISLKTKAITSQFRFPRTRKYNASSWKSTESW